MADHDAQVRDAARRVDDARRALAKAEERLEELQNLPEEPHGHSTIIRWAKRYGGTYTTYIFVAVRIEDRWYVTGSASHGVSYKWEDLIAFMRTKGTFVTKPHIVPTPAWVGDDLLIPGF